MDLYEGFTFYVDIIPSNSEATSGFAAWFYTSSGRVFKQNMRGCLGLCKSYTVRCNSVHTNKQPPITNSSS